MVLGCLVFVFLPLLELFVPPLHPWVPGKALQNPLYFFLLHTSPRQICWWGGVVGGAADGRGRSRWEDPYQ